MITAITDQFWILETPQMAYACGLDAQGRLVHTYWGPALPRLEDYPCPQVSPEWSSFNQSAHLAVEEYPAHGGPKYTEPCLHVHFPDGTRDLDLQLTQAEIVPGDQPTLRLHLRDVAFPLSVTLHYCLHAPGGMLERFATITHTGDGLPFLLKRAWSAQWHFPALQPTFLTHLAGRWYDEFTLYREALTPGVKVLESRRLTTGHDHQPWFAVDQGAAQENSGDVWFGALAWSGNWKLAAEVTGFGTTRLSLGINDWDFAWTLSAGETLTTPSCFAGFTRAGFGGASRAMHDFIRDEVLPDGQTLRPVLYNSWEATFFDVDEPSQRQLADVAADLGAELFVVDDGWFSGRNLDNAGLGDWWPDPRKFPNGLRPLIEHVVALGMSFGLWIEPEMVNPDSDLYRAHPNWVIHFPARPRTEARQQLILNLARPDVQEYLIGTLSHLLAENDIRFIKWDMNRSVSEPGWSEAPNDSRELWVRYVQGLYHVWDTLSAQHPHVTWQTCSGGGGRVDLGVLRRANQAWISDNTHAAARLAIQDGYSRMFPANTMEAWVTDADRGHLPLLFRFHVSMLGLLGLGGQLLHWTAEERSIAREQIRLYKDIRHIVQGGDQYRLRGAQDHAFSAVQYVSKDKSEGVLFAFRTHLPRPQSLPPIYLRGLDPNAVYDIDGFGAPRSGAAWMNVGLQLELNNYESAVRLISCKTSGA
jgi:alpha-galactosidase